MTCLAALLVAAWGGAQTPTLGSTGNWRPDPTRAAIVTPADVTFGMLAQAPSSWDYTSAQVRRFLDPRGRLVQIRESLEVRGDYTSDSPFQLLFQGVVGGTAIEQAKWRDVYKGTAGLIHRHGAFAVRDVVAAAGNYTLHDFGAVMRASRAARRVVVFPHQADKGIWVIDLDTQTGLPLYRAEFDSRGHLLAELEVTQLQVLGLAAATSSRLSWGWKPRLAVQRYTSLQTARLQAGAVAVLPDLSSVVGEYAQHLVQVTTDPINGDQSLVLGYTDGVDEFFVVEGFNSLDPFPSLTQATNTTKRTHVVASYDDPSMRIYVFHDRGVTYQVAGNSSLRRLQDVARLLCAQAVNAK